MGDADLRLAAFDWQAREVDRRGDVLPWALLARGFDFKGGRVPLVSQQGIFKPRALAQGVPPGNFLRVQRTLRQGLGYVNVQTDHFPGREIRGQVSFEPTP